MLFRSPLPLPSLSLSPLADHNPLKDFSQDGYVALKSLTEFLKRYGDEASQMGVEFAQKRVKHCTLPQVVNQLSRYTAECLRLTQGLGGNTTAPMQYLAKQLSWTLLSEENCFQVRALRTYVQIDRERERSVLVCV